MQISLKLIGLINHAKITVCIKFQFFVISSSLFTDSSSLSVFPRSVLYVLLLYRLLLKIFLPISPNYFLPWYYQYSFSTLLPIPDLQLFPGRWGPPFVDRKGNLCLFMRFKAHATTKQRYYLFFISFCILFFQTAGTFLDILDVTSSQLSALSSFTHACAPTR